MSNLDYLIATIREPATNPLRRAQIIGQLIEEHGLSKSKIATIIHKSPSYVSNHLRLLHLPDSVKDAVVGDMISEGHARALSTLDDSQDMLELFEDVVRYGYSVRRTEQAVDSKRKTKRMYGKIAPEFKKLEEHLSSTMKLNTRITRRQHHIMLTLSFPYSIIGFRALRTAVGKLLG